MALILLVNWWQRVVCSQKQATRYFLVVSVTLAGGLQGCRERNRLKRGSVGTSLPPRLGKLTLVAPPPYALLRYRKQETRKLNY